MVVLGSALLGGIFLVLVTFIQEGWGRRRHLSLIKSEAEALAVIDPDQRARKHLERSLARNLRTYGRWSNVELTTKRRAQWALGVGAAVYVGSAVLLPVLAETTSLSRLSIYAILVPLAMIGSVLSSFGALQLRRFRLQNMYRRERILTAQDRYQLRMERMRNEESGSYLADS